MAGCKGLVEAVIVSDSVYLFGQGTFIFIRENSGNFDKWHLVDKTVFNLWLRSTFARIQKTITNTNIGWSVERRSKSWKVL